MNHLGKKRLGYTLVELLVVIVLFLVLGSAVFYLVIKGLKWFTTFSGTEKQEVSTEFNVDLLVFDLKHVGYGISENEISLNNASYLILSYCNGTNDTSNPACIAADNLNAKKGKLLLIKETSNVVRSQSQIPTVGFVLWNGSQVVYAEPSSANNSSYQCVWLKADDKSLASLNPLSCSGDSSLNGIFAIGFPLDPGACQNDTNPLCCKEQNCTGIAYFLDLPNTNNDSFPKRCMEGTYIFYRKIPGGNGSIYKIPLLNCVADWDVWFELDTNNDGIADTYRNTLPNDIVNNNTALKQSLLAVDVYFLVQASYSADYTYDFSKGNRQVNTTEAYIVADTLPDGTEVRLHFPTDNGDVWKHYRWKVFKVKVTDFPNLR